MSQAVEAPSAAHLCTVRSRRGLGGLGASEPRRSDAMMIGPIGLCRGLFEPSAGPVRFSVMSPILCDSCHRNGHGRNPPPNFMGTPTAYGLPFVMTPLFYQIATLPVINF
eukprot:765723-Hanusia_phi.AAC.3